MRGPRKPTGAKTHSEIDHAVVQAGVKEYALVLHILGGGFRLRPVCVFYGERQTTVETRYQVDLNDTVIICYLS